jgi:endoglycosylceramidase
MIRHVFQLQNLMGSITVLFMTLFLSACSINKPSTSLAVKIEAPPTSLVANGRWMTDQQGRVIIFRGVNLVNKKSPYTYLNSGITEEDARIIRAAGMNVVRLGIFWDAIEPIPGQYNDAYLKDISSTITMLKSYGINTLLDMHQDQYSSSCNGVGAPDWATIINLAKFPKGCNPNKLPFPRGELTDPSVSDAWDGFWQNKSSASTGLVGLQDRYAATWAYVAKSIGDTPGIVGYEIMNEPYPGTVCKAKKLGDECILYDQGVYAKFIELVSSKIRNVDSKTLIFFEPSVFFDFGTATHVIPPNVPNVGFSFHPYLTMNHVLANAFVYHNKYPTLPLLATEWGAFTGDKPLTENMVPAEITAGSMSLDKAMMPAIYWTYVNPAPISFLPDAYKQGLVRDLNKPRTVPNLMVDRLNALTWPYPQAVAGMPLEWSFNPERRLFQMSYDSNSPSGRRLDVNALTEIVLPSERFKNGYEVFVEGARVVSPRNADKLVILNQSDAKIVKILVKGL